MVFQFNVLLHYITLEGLYNPLGAIWIASQHNQYTSSKNSTLNGDMTYNIKEVIMTIIQINKLSSQNATACLGTQQLFC